MPIVPNENEKLGDLVKDTPVPENTTRVVSSKRNAAVDPVTPEILNMTSMKDLINELGEEMCVSKLQAQLIIDFRSIIRGQMDSYDSENEVFRHDLENIESADYTDWKPELRVRKSAEEKAADMFGKMSPDQIKAAMAKAGIDISKLG